MLEIKDIREAIQSNAALAVYQLAILDYLNSAKTAVDIAGMEPGSGAIADDPRKRGKGYDIGIKVAKSILKRRKELGGSFISLDQLANIAHFGKDKLQDLIYTYMTLRPPIPTGLGQQFDDFIVTLSQLEIDAYQSGYSSGQTLSSVRKLFFDATIPSQDKSKKTKLNWNKMIPGTKDLNPPSSWSVRTNLIQLMDYIAEHSVVQIGSEQISVQTLIAALDAKSNPDKVVTGNNKLKLNSNLDAASYLMKLASTAYQYLSPFSISASQNFRIQQKQISTIYNKEISLAEFASIADAHNMEFDTARSLSWNLLNYYTNKDKPTESRYIKLASSLNLGEYVDGVLNNDNKKTRSVLLKKVQDTSLFILIENGRSQVVNRMLSNTDNDGSYMAYRTASAYILDLFLDRLLILVGLEINKPAIISWNRLEARPRTEDFSRTLRAEVRDALWFLSRQWQLGEFRAEDTGSALEMRVDMQTSKVDRFSLKGGEAGVFDQSIPMETTVERETVFMDLTLRQEMGRQFESLLQKKLSASPNAFAQSTINDVIADFKNESSFQFNLPVPAGEHPDIYSNPALLKNYAAIGNGRMLDGGAVYTSIKSGTAASTTVSSTSSANALARVNDAAQELLIWFERVYSQPQSSVDSAWNPEQLEYQFQCSAASSNSSKSVLSTTEYANGHLDWYSFDFEMSSDNYPASLTNGAVNQDKIDRKLITVLATDLRYPGMPMPRWWQFEDFKVDLGGIKANTSELPKLLMTEFALIYSNDWMLMPFNVEVGSLCDIKSVVVRDVFGQHTLVNAAGAGDNSDWQRCSMYNLKRNNLTSITADTRLFVPPAVVRTMESDPIERVGLLQDEMSNMVWGIEKLIPDGLGGSIDGSQAARRLNDYLVRITPELIPIAPLEENDAAIHYKIGSIVPPNWIPFIPIRQGGVDSRQIQLRRAAMPRIIRGRPTERIRPKTELLKTGYDPLSNKWNPYFLHQQEVPRSGVIIDRSWQRSRWMNGKTHTWLGRRVRNGRGEANSGLEFDQVELIHK